MVNLKNNNIFIITRFNLYLPNLHAGSTIDEYTGITPDYIKQRFELFEKYCLPSIEAQTDKDFYWFILMNADTPDIFKSRIESIVNRSEAKIVLLYMKEYNLELIKQKILELKNNSNWVTSIRIDNDDILAKNFVEEVRKIAPHINKTVINFERGLHYNLKTREIGIHSAKANHFISYVEDISENFELVYKCGHNKILSSGINKYINIKKKPMWAELVHDTNVVNEFNSSPIAIEDDILDYLNNFSKKKKDYKLFYKLKLADKTIYFINILGLRIRYTKRHNTIN